MTTRNRLLTLTVAAAATLSIAGCASYGGGEPDARWADYKTWTKVIDGQTGDPTSFIGNVHRGPEGYRNVLVNATALETVNSGEEGRKFPAGSILIKEQYKSKADWEAGKGAQVTIGVKTEDDKWNWATKLGGTPGEDAFCQGCHTIAAAHDFMFTGGGYEK